MLRINPVGGTYKQPVRCIYTPSYPIIYSKLIQQDAEIRAAVAQL